MPFQGGRWLFPIGWRWISECWAVISSFPQQKANCFYKIKKTGFFWKSLVGKVVEKGQGKEQQADAMAQTYLSKAVRELLYCCTIREEQHIQRMNLSPKGSWNFKFPNLGNTVLFCLLWCFYFHSHHLKGPFHIPISPPNSIQPN